MESTGRRTPLTGVRRASGVALNVVLLGDSVFDNGAYVAPGADVVHQLQAVLPPGASATLRAVDGATTGAVAGQLGRLPRDATHLVVSAGGNDAIGYMDVLDAASHSVGESLDRLATVARDFAQRYEEMLTAVLAHDLPTAVCTVYDPRFPDPAFQRIAVTALALLNDVILRGAAGLGLPVVDLRLICTSDDDFANAIEPSAAGGARIAAAIAHLVEEHDFTRARSEIFAR
jgi:lysophospholipase L1-like esterase